MSQTRQTLLVGKYEKLRAEYEGLGNSPGAQNRAERLVKGMERVAGELEVLDAEKKKAEASARRATTEAGLADGSLTI